MNDAVPYLPYEVSAVLLGVVLGASGGKAAVDHRKTFEPNWNPTGLAVKPLTGFFLVFGMFALVPIGVVLDWPDVNPTPLDHAVQVGEAAVLHPLVPSLFLGSLAAGLAVVSSLYGRHVGYRPRVYGCVAAALSAGALLTLTSLAAAANPSGPQPLPITDRPWPLWELTGESAEADALPIRLTQQPRGELANVADEVVANRAKRKWLGTRGDESAMPHHSAAAFGEFLLSGEVPLGETHRSIVRRFSNDGYRAAVGGLFSTPEESIADAIATIEELEGIDPSDAAALLAAEDATESLFFGVHPLVLEGREPVAMYKGGLLYDGDRLKRVVGEMRQSGEAGPRAVFVSGAVAALTLLIGLCSLIPSTDATRRF